MNFAIKLRVACRHHRPSHATVIHEIDLNDAVTFLERYGEHGGDEEAPACIEAYIEEYLKNTRP